MKEVDFLNIMTYDMMNRRDHVVNHHSGVADSRNSLQLYIDRGCPAHRANLGLGYYAKWYHTQNCNSAKPLGCSTVLMEDPDSGADLGQCGAFSWHDKIQPELYDSFARSLSRGTYFSDGSYGYWDDEQWRRWSFDTPKSISSKIAEVMVPMKLGGVFAWGVGEDAPRFAHLKATVDGFETAKSQKFEQRHVHTELNARQEL